MGVSPDLKRQGSLCYGLANARPPVGVWLRHPAQRSRTSCHPVPRTRDQGLIQLYPSPCLRRGQGEVNSASLTREGLFTSLIMFIVLMLAYAGAVKSPDPEYSGEDLQRKARPEGARPSKLKVIN